MYKFFKPLIDIILVVISAPFWIPVYAIISLLIYFKIGSPILFQQSRLGEDGEVFKIYKFRSMTDKKDKDGILLDDHLRLTSFGKFLRSSSLDELPSLLNVLQGHMSIVGPRPFIAEYKELYNDFQMRRHEVKPGITGWAQINGRNAITWQQKFEYDIWYVENYSFLLDWKIIFLTLKKVISSEGINAADDSTMDYFKGNN